jgi:hypothetical protein
MDILRNLFGSLTSGIIRLLVTVGILAAAYFFLVKPVLQTTDHAIDSANKTIEESFSGSGVDDLSKVFDDANRQVQRQIRRSLHSAQKNGSPKRLIKCLEHADGDARKVRRCTVKF